MKQLLITLTAITLLASCVEPPRVMVEDDRGMIYAVKRPSWEVSKGDTIIIGHIGKDGMLPHIAGRYKGVIPESDTTNNIVRWYTIGRITQ